MIPGFVGSVLYAGPAQQLIVTAAQQRNTLSGQQVQSLFGDEILEI